ncbi:hypothetical protein APHAL10511_000116 [Amanita phalloides]|nr:hypothetical protein APHAL10511_000116 [Amanita phalloides]
MSLPSLPDTLISKIQEFDNHDVFSPDITHPFSTGVEETSTLLQNLIHTTHQISTSINAYASTSFSNQKLVSALRQYSIIAQTLHTSDQNIQHLAHSIKEQAGKGYGENIPLDPSLIADWCVSRLVACGSAAGMEAFKDEGKEGIVTVLLGGKVLVIDVDLSIDRSEPGKSRIRDASAKTSYATMNSSSNNGGNANGSPYLDKFLSKSIQSFCNQVQDGDPDPVKAAGCIRSISKQLQYLVLLDGLAARKDSAGVKWFIDLDEQWPMLENLAKEEAAVIASTLSVTRTPLDIFLQRAHALPLPHLNCPSLSFLVYVSPRAYLSLLQQQQVRQVEGPFDIGYTHLRDFLDSYSRGAIMATLQLLPHSGLQLFPASMSMPSLTSRPTFPLFLKGPELEHVLIEVPGASIDVSAGANARQHYSWALDFTLGGRTSGIVLSQSRMREIEMILNPLGGMDNLPSVGILSFQPASWVSLLLKPDSPLASERYIATYQSPTNAHPPLSLRLITPNEPGFILQKVPVHSMREIWGVLEVVRDQCWLNELLLGCQWSTSTDDETELTEVEATELELEAALSGTMTPQRIPVSLYLPANDSAADSLFGSALDTMAMAHMPPRRPKIVMTSPERPPMSGLVQISVVCDEIKPRGVSVEVNGAMGAEIKAQELEEMCRRGGILGLCGNIWARS